MKNSKILKNPRASVGLPAERVEQIRSLAKARGITATALIEGWINRAYVEGEPGSIELPGYHVSRHDDFVVLAIAGHILPMMDEQRAVLLSAMLDGFAGTLIPPRAFELPSGMGTFVDLGGATLTGCRQGRGVLFTLADKASGEMKRFAVPASYGADLARMIRAVLIKH